MTAIVWFRRDLRLNDNPALSRACAQHQPVVPVFCMDPRLLSGPNRSLPRTRFLCGCLKELARELTAAGSGLLVLLGRPEQTLPELARSCGADLVLAADDVGPFARRRDAAVAAALGPAGCSLELQPGTFVVDDLSSLRTQAGDPYSLFTPFFRTWLRAPRRQPRSRPPTLPPLPDGLPRGPVPALESLDLDKLPDTSSDPQSMRWEPGERAARSAADRFLDAAAHDYGHARDLLSADGTSRLSPYLHFGCISPRELEATLPHGAGAEALRRQLGWRDFYAHVLLFHPANVRGEQQVRYRRRISWNRAPEPFDAWCRGRTGYPLVDAAMRQLARCGWMHNRTRMVVGSFLVKDLGIDWRWGERWFMRMLLDGDLASNNGNWQWIASVGVDPQPVSRRLYNPGLQQRRFDPDGDYVRAHVPELRNVPPQYLPEPWKMPIEIQRQVGCVIGVDYPEPIVDHMTARKEALERYARAAAQ